MSNNPINALNKWLSLTITLGTGSFPFSWLLSKKLGYVGYDGALKYFIDRQKLECDLLRNLTTKKVIFEQKEDYDIVFNMIINYLE